TGMSTWMSSNQMVADVSNAGGPGGGRGSVTALAPGTATITATYMGVSSTAMVTVSSATLTSIQVTRANPSIPKGNVQPFQAVGIFSDGTSRMLTGQATWQSSNTDIAAVSNAGGSRGQVTTLAAGTTQL